MDTAPEAVVRKHAQAHLTSLDKARARRAKWYLEHGAALNAQRRGKRAAARLARESLKKPPVSPTPKEESLAEWEAAFLKSIGEK